jgi:hypothetical protein
MEMPNIETIEGTMSVPAPLNLLLQGLIKIFADDDGDGNITQAESDAFLDLMPEDERDNLSLSLDDLEPVIQTGLGIDFRQPRTVEVLDMDFIGLVGPVNSSEPLGFLITFHAEFNVEDSISHTISIGVNESYTGDVDFEFTVPSGWKIDGVTGLSGSTIEGRTVYGTPVTQINIMIMEEIVEDILYICIGIGVVIIVVIIIAIVLLLKKKGKKDAAPVQQYPATAPAPYPVMQPQQPPPRPAPPPQQFQEVRAPPPPVQPAVNACPVCRGPLSFVQQYQRYYCNNCRQYR